ncbi:MAG TPA: fatty acid desaturase [Vicinamibacterales bacterium]
MSTLDYIRVTHGEPHAERGRRMLAAHPELRRLAGYSPTTAIWIVCLVIAQIGLALLLGGRGWIWWLPCSYIVGATIDHALWALIHDCSHNLVFRSRTPNRLISIVANLPLVVPSAISFAKYHLLHHRHMGDMDLDAGVPGPTESAVIGRSRFAKAVWLAGTIVVQGAVRPNRLKVRLMDGWTAANIVIQFVCIGLLAALVGAGPFKYLIASTVFAIGLHPLGARWIQEHFARVPDQETYSYYGPLNKVCFNVGYHNEHHDLVTIPWSRLPEVRRMAPEFYAGLHSYSSWTALLIEFLRNRQMTLFDYIIRPRTTDRSPSDDTVQWHPKDEKAPQPRYQAGTSMAGKG